MGVDAYKKSEKEEPTGAPIERKRGDARDPGRSEDVNKKVSPCRR